MTAQKRAIMELFTGGDHYTCIDVRSIITANGSETISGDLDNLARRGWLRSTSIVEGRYKRKTWEITNTGRLIVEQEKGRAAHA